MARGVTVPLFHRDLGGAGHAPLIILHGMLGSSRNWQTVGRDLAARYHVHALDARNHGASPHAEPMNYPAMAADVIAWLDAQHLDRVTLLGHSMGGKTAMWLACRHPERVARLIVVDIAPRNYAWPAHREEFAALNELDLTTLRSRADAEKRMEKRVPEWAMRKFLATNLETDASHRWRWAINLPVISAALTILERDPLKAEDRFNGPAHFISGGRSPYVTAHDESAIRRHFPAAKQVVLPHAGHNPHIERREEFVAAVN